MRSFKKLSVIILALCLVAVAPPTFLPMAYSLPFSSKNMANPSVELTFLTFVCFDYNNTFAFANSTGNEVEWCDN